MIFDEIVVEKTKEQKIAEFMAGEFGENNRFYNRIDDFHKDRWNAFWNHPEFTPIEIIQAIGKENTLKIFGASKAMQTMLKTINPAYEVMEPPKEAMVAIQGLLK